MSALELQTFLSEEDYLKLEEFSEAKHECVAGVVYAMAGVKNRHNEIVSNCQGSLFAKLRGSQCKPFNSDTKVRIDFATGTRYYYPDCLVVCDRNRDEEVFQEKPNLIIEVLSASTRRTDISEKKDAYLSIPTLNHYLIVEPDEAKVIVYRRDGQEFQQSIVEGVDNNIVLSDLEITLSLAEIYQDIDL